MAVVVSVKKSSAFGVEAKRPGFGRFSRSSFEQRFAFF
jgi:hypothetical protein